MFPDFRIILFEILVYKTKQRQTTSSKFINSSLLWEFLFALKNRDVCVYVHTSIYNFRIYNLVLG